MNIGSNGKPTPQFAQNKFQRAPFCQSLFEKKSLRSTFLLQIPSDPTSAPDICSPEIYIPTDCPASSLGVWSDIRQSSLISQKEFRSEGYNGGNEKNHSVMIFTFLTNFIIHKQSSCSSEELPRLNRVNKLESSTLPNITLSRQDIPMNLQCNEPAFFSRA
ncbi:hypothetical protein AVEN_59530-1 [Araneus ventricosus]|uniref:Uncharacterized protein n=1 Tax=Araneus ventricosus TaxID=182803 RepID=A0A4Y2NWX4_ARAVE|nr:hypothetical protein AVEN_59530-1 [Araneus ventricosus]